MALERPRSGHRTSDSALGLWLRPHVALAGPVALASIPLLLTAALLPPDLVLPALSLLALAAAFLMALFAWGTRARRDGDRVTAWDIAGASAFVGIAAGMLSEPSHVLRLFGHAMAVN